MMKTFSQTEYGKSRVAVVILAKNEEKTIGKIINDTARFVHEVIVMDGHSRDETANCARSAGAMVYTDDGKGKGSAMRMSLKLTTADIIVFMDADGSHDPNDIPKLVLPVVRNKTDLCVGSRFSGGSDELSVNVGQLIRTFGNLSMNIAINKRWHVNLTDTLNGLRAIKRQAALSIGLREDIHTIEQEIVMKMLSHGYRVINVPTHEYARKFGRSHINIWKEWPRFVWCLIINLIHKERINHL